jgi:hypothetical protein
MPRERFTFVAYIILRRYTTGVATKDKAKQKAVVDLVSYSEDFAAF